MSAYASEDGFYFVSVLLQGESDSRLYNTTIKSYEGWTYMVIQFEKYGIAANIGNKFTKMTVEVRSRYILTTYTSEAYINTFTVRDLLKPPIDPAIGVIKPRVLFGHKGSLAVLDVGTTSRHMDGIYRLFRVTTG